MTTAVSFKGYQMQKKHNASVSSRAPSKSLMLQGFTLMFLLCIVCCNGQQQLRRQQQSLNSDSNNEAATNVLDLSLDFDATIPLDSTPGGRKIRDAVSSVSDIRTAMVLEHGKIVAHYIRPGLDPNQGYQIWSSTKTFLGLLIGIMVDEGLLSVDETLGDIWPESDYATMWSNVTDAAFRENITIRSLLTMSSGLFIPGDVGFGTWYDGGDAGGIDLSSSLSHGTANETTNQFQYLTTGSYLSYVIQARTGMTPGRYAEVKVFPFLGMHLKNDNNDNDNDNNSVEWWKNADGVEYGYHGLMMNAFQMAKVGQLILQKGVSGNNTVVSPEWMKEQTTVMGVSGMQYGFLTWVQGGTCQGDNDGEDCIEKTYCAKGMFGQNICVSETLDRVTVQQTDQNFDQGIGSKFEQIAFDKRTSFDISASEDVDDSSVVSTVEEEVEEEVNPCAAAAELASCFDEFGCSFRNETTMLWYDVFEECNMYAPLFSACFPNSLCSFVDTTVADVDVDWLTPFIDASARSVLVNGTENDSIESEIPSDFVIRFSWSPLLWEGDNDVYVMPSKQAYDNCDFNSLSPFLIGKTSPVYYTMNETKTYYFAGSYNQCKAGQKLEALVMMAMGETMTEDDSSNDVVEDDNSSGVREENINESGNDNDIMGTIDSNMAKEGAETEAIVTVVDDNDAIENKEDNSNVIGNDFGDGGMQKEAETVVEGVPEKDVEGPPEEDVTVEETSGTIASIMTTSAMMVMNSLAVFVILFSLV